MYPEEIKHVHQTVPTGPKVSLKLSRNSRGFNWEISISGAQNSQEAIELLQDAQAKIEDHLKEVR